MACREYCDYGGNTSCFLLDCGFHLVFDAGTGIRKLGQELSDREPVHIFLSHLHLDHIMGLPALFLLFQEDQEIHIYGEDHEGKTIEALLKEVICPPFWPFSLDDSCVKAKIYYHTVCAHEVCFIQGIKVTSVRLPHPNACLGWIVEKGQQRVAYLLDCEINERKDAPDSMGIVPDACSLAVMDSSFLPGQVIPGFGHSSWKECQTYAEEKGIKTVLFSHFGDTMTDQILDSENEGNRGSSIFAREGMELEIDEKGEVRIYEKER